MKTAKVELGPDDVKRIEDRIKELRNEKATNLELIKADKADTRNQFNSFRETIEKVMNENKTLGEKR